MEFIAAVQQRPSKSDIVEGKTESFKSEELL
jgi:hypothetical protein